MGADLGFYDAWENQCQNLNSMKYEEEYPLAFQEVEANGRHLPQWVGNPSRKCSFMVNEEYLNNVLQKNQENPQANQQKMEIIPADLLPMKNIESTMKARTQPQFVNNHHEGCSCNTCSINQINGINQIQFSHEVPNTQQAFQMAQPQMMMPQQGMPMQFRQMNGQNNNNQTANLMFPGNTGNGMLMPFGQMYLVPAQLPNNQFCFVPCYMQSFQNNNNTNVQQSEQNTKPKESKTHSAGQVNKTNPNSLCNSTASGCSANFVPGSPIAEEKNNTDEDSTQSNKNKKEDQYILFKRKMERRVKIEKYKAKKRNWLRKISYKCRKTLADTRLRIKGRFISKKDSERFVTLYGNQEITATEFLVNDTKNLNIEMIPNHEVIKVSDTGRRRLKAVKRLVEMSKNQLFVSRIGRKLKRQENIFKITRCAKPSQSIIESLVSGNL
jgi:hypothetical protein